MPRISLLTRIRLAILLTFLWLPGLANANLAGTLIELDLELQQADAPPPDAAEQQARSAFEALLGESVYIPKNYRLEQVDGQFRLNIQHLSIPAFAAPVQVGPAVLWIEPEGDDKTRFQLNITPETQLLFPGMPPMPLRATNFGWSGNWDTQLSRLTESRLEIEGFNAASEDSLIVFQIDSLSSRTQLEVDEDNSWQEIHRFSLKEAELLHRQFRIKVASIEGSDVYHGNDIDTDNKREQALAELEKRDWSNDAAARPDEMLEWYSELLELHPDVQSDYTVAGISVTQNMNGFVFSAGSSELTASLITVSGEDKQAGAGFTVDSMLWPDLGFDPRFNPGRMGLDLNLRITDTGGLPRYAAKLESSTVKTVSMDQGEGEDEDVFPTVDMQLSMEQTYLHSEAVQADFNASLSLDRFAELYFTGKGQLRIRGFKALSEEAVRTSHPALLAAVGLLSGFASSEHGAADVVTLNLELSADGQFYVNDVPFPIHAQPKVQ